MYRPTLDLELHVSTMTSSSRAYCEKFFGWLRLTSVEPTMWLYMMAYMTTSVVEQALFVYKACRVNHGLSEDYCRNTRANKTLNDEIQRTVSVFLQWNNIAGHAAPIILALWFGNWSDRRGRKLPLLIGLCGKLVYSAMIVVNSMMPDWDLYMIVYTASLPMSMLGGDVAIFASCFAYISDVSSVAQRTLRVTILDVVYLSTMPTGVALGSYLFASVFDSSYAIMFGINTALLVLAIVYTFFALEWQTNIRQRSLAGVNAFTDFFDKEHVRATVRMLTRPRPDRKRLHLWILFLAMALYTFQRDERSISYLYTQKVFDWNFETFSTFRTYQSALFVIAMLVGTPTMSKLLGMRDTLIVIVGALSHAVGRIFFATATTGAIFYVGAGVAALGPIVAPVLRSMTSKVVPVEERGKVFAMLSVCDNAVPLFSGILYSQLYKATLDTAPWSVYWLTFATQAVVMLLIALIQLSSGPNDNAGNNEDSRRRESRSSESSGHDPPNESYEKRLEQDSIG